MECSFKYHWWLCTVSQTTCTLLSGSHIKVRLDKRFALLVLSRWWDVCYFKIRWNLEAWVNVLVCVRLHARSLVILSVMYSVPAPSTTALHNDQSLRDARAWLQPAVIIIITFEVITIPQPHSLHIVPLSFCFSFSLNLAHTHAHTHAQTHSKVLSCLMFLDTGWVLKRG